MIRILRYAITLLLGQFVDCSDELPDAVIACVLVGNSAPRISEVRAE